MKISSIFTLSVITASALFSTACQEIQDPGPEGADMGVVGMGGSGNGSGSGAFGPGNGGFGPGGQGGAGDFTSGGLIDANDPNSWKRIEGANLPSIYFATDANTLGQTEATKLDQITEWIAAYPDVGLIIEGNCDERGTEEYNRALGERRALAVKEYLQQRGLSEARMHTLSYGEDKPKAQGASEDAYQENRRADVIPAKMK